jgi:acetyl-CoA acetyltransferase
MHKQVIKAQELPCHRVQSFSHPIGATGAVLTTKLIHSMRRDGLTRGLVTLCIGGGQGIALAIEALH